MHNMTWLHQIFPDFEIVLEYDDIDDTTLPKEEIHGFPLTKSGVLTMSNMSGMAERQAEKQLNPPCLFCHKPSSAWTKKDIAHAVSECLGNKRLINALECYDCNHLFGEIAENHLGKFIMPYRFIAKVYGKDRRKGKGRQKNVIRDGKQGKDNTEPFRTFRFEQKKNAPVFESKIFPSETYPFDIKSLLIEVKDKGGRLEFTDYGFKLKIPRQPYDPRMVYASFLKMFYTLLPCVKQPAGTPNYDLQAQSYGIYNSDYWDYLKGQISLYLALSKKNPLYAPDGSSDGTGATQPLIQPFLEEDREKYLFGLPNKGIEVRFASKDVPNGVNVCLLRKRKTTSVVFGNNEAAGRETVTYNNENSGRIKIGATIGRDEPRYLFAVQLKWYTLVIPACSDPIQPDMPNAATAATTAKITNDNQGLPRNVLEPGIPYSFNVRCTPTSEITVRPLDFTKVESEMIFDMRAEKIDIPEELYSQLSADLRKAGLLEEKKPSKQLVGLVIQRFSDLNAANAITNMAFPFLHYAKDETLLSNLTISMIIAVARFTGMKWTSAEALYFLKAFMGYYLENRGIALPLKWLPLIGSLINIYKIRQLTEALGWATYVFVNNRIENFLSLTEKEKNQLWEEAKKLKESEEKKIKSIYTQMTTIDKEEFDAILGRMKSEELSENEREVCLSALEKIATKYQ